MKKRLFALLLIVSMLLTLLPVTASAANGAMNTIPAGYDAVIDLYNRTSDVNISDSRTYYIYSSVPDKLRDQWSWKWKIQIKGSSAAPHIFIDGLNIEVSPSAKTPAIEVHGKATAYLYFIGRDSTLQGATGRAAIQKNRSEGQVHVLVRTGTTVTCKGGEKAAGIGGSYATRKIFDGLYNGDMFGHGVNLHFGSQGNPDYWGGTIAATGGEGGAGIGSGRGGSGEKLYFYSGTVQANGGRWAAGIGGSYEGRSSEIHILGGSVNAYGGEGGAGIGSGCWKTEQDMDGINAARGIYISGGMVNACGGYNGAGIGGGQFVPAHDITITGGYITARGVYGAAIGGGRWMHARNITVTDANLKLTTGRWSNGSDAAAMGYGDLVYKLEDLVKDPSSAANDAIKIGSKKKEIVWLKAEAYGLTANGRCVIFNFSDFLIPNERGLIDVSLLSLPFAQNYGWTIYELEMTMMYTSCEGDHTYGWKDWNGYHIWGCKRCFGRDPAKQGPAPNGKHIPGDWEGWEKKCTVCGVVTTKDTTPPVIEGLVDGRDYDPYDTDDGQPGTISFTVSDPAGKDEVSSGVKSVTVNGVEQTGPTYHLTAPDGGNNDEGLVYEVVATDHVGNSATAKVRLYRRHRVLFVEDRDLTKYIELGVPHGFDLDFPFNHLPKEAYFVDLDDESIKIYRDVENETYNFGVITSHRTFLLVIPKTELPELSIQFMRERFYGYQADAADAFCYANPVSKYGDGYLMSIWVPSDETSYYFETSERYTLEQLEALDKDETTPLPWREFDKTVIATFIGPSFEDYKGEWYVYAKATNEVGTKYVSTPRIIIEGELPVARVYPSGNELAGLTVGDIHFDGVTYWGGLQFTVTDELPFTVKDGQTVLEPDENGVYTIPADMNDHVYHHIYIEDACGNTARYLGNKVRWNTLDWRALPGDLSLPYGAKLEDALPKTVMAHTAMGGDQTDIPIPVIWEIPEEYDPAAKQEQRFTVNGTLDLSDTDIVVNPGKAYWQDVWVQVTVAAARKYTVTLGSIANGSVTAVNASETLNGTPMFCEGELVMLSAVPEEGYLLKSLTVTGDSGESVACSGDGETYSFIQPNTNVTVSAEFEKLMAVRPVLEVTGEYIYDGTEQFASVAGYDERTMNISGNSGTDAGTYTVSVTPKPGQWSDGTPDAVTAEWRIEQAVPEAPGGLLGVAPTTRGGSDGRITGADASMEYRAASESAYLPCPGAEITGLTAGTYYVRYRASEDRNYAASPETAVIVGEGAEAGYCTVSFDKNGGSGSMASASVRKGSDYTLPACGFTAPAGKQFKGWALSAGGAVLSGSAIDVTADITLYAIWVEIPAAEFVVSFDGNGGTPAIDRLFTAGRRLSSLPDAFRSGYRFDGWYMERTGGAPVTTDTEFFASTTVYAHWTAIGGGSGWYDSTRVIKASAGTGGSITPSGNVSVRMGADQTFTITPDGGYAIADVKVDGRSVGAVRSYTFENVSSAHTIEVSFGPAGTFADIPAGSYYEEAVGWAVANGITTGTDASRFSPDSACTRAQAVTFLWRAAGSPAPKTSGMPFADVPANSYFHDAVLWAVENGITTGTSKTAFSPDTPCTRAQIVSFLYRLVQSEGGGFTGAWMFLLPFSDTPDWAYEAVAWCYQKGITSGTTATTFSPDAPCTRAQIVTFLWRCKK